MNPNDTNPRRGFLKQTGAALLGAATAGTLTWAPKQALGSESSGSHHPQDPTIDPRLFELSGRSLSAWMLSARDGDSIIYLCQACQGRRPYEIVPGRRSICRECDDTGSRHAPVTYRENGTDYPVAIARVYRNEGRYYAQVLITLSGSGPDAPRRSRTLALEQLVI